VVEVNVAVGEYRVAVTLTVVVPVVTPTIEKAVGST
jgi:hypothetical protein